MKEGLNKCLEQYSEDKSETLKMRIKELVIICNN